MSQPDPEAILRRIEWTVLRRLDGVFQGGYRTLFRGEGLDLADLREYQPRDDVRHIDWNVTARLGTPYVREFHEDREITAWFLLDVSPSVDFGSQDRNKEGVLVEFVAILARLLTRNGNRVGAIFFDSELASVIPPGGGRNRVLQILKRLDAPRTPGNAEVTDLGALLTGAGRIMQRRSYVFVVSDFISRPGWGPSLMNLARRHEVLAVRLFDPLEMALPDLGLVVMQDAETGEQVLVDTHDPGFRERFQSAAAEREAELRETLTHAGVDALELSTADDPVEAILRFADLRKTRNRVASHRALPTHLEVGR